MKRCLILTAAIAAASVFCLSCGSSKSSPATYGSYDYYSPRYPSYDSSLRYVDPPARNTPRYDREADWSTWKQQIEPIEQFAEVALYPSEYETEYWPVPLANDAMSLAAEYYSLGSHNVDTDYTDDRPDILLASDDESPSFVVYHFAPIPAGRTLSSIRISRLAEFYGPEDRGFFMGYRQREDLAYTWYGPFRDRNSWQLDLRPVQTVAQTSPSLVIAVAGGDELQLHTIVTNVISFRDFYLDQQYEEHLYQQRLYDYELDRYWLEFDRLQLLEAQRQLERENERLWERLRKLERQRERELPRLKHRRIEARESERRLDYRRDLVPPAG